MLYKSDIDSKKIEDGRDHEEEARLELDKLLGVQIFKFGLFIGKKDF